MTINKFSGLFLFCMIVAANAFAHHEPVKELREQAEILDGAVRASDLSCCAKGVIRNFLAEVVALDECVDQNPSGEGQPVSPSCQPQLSEVRDGFGQVTYILQNASDLPSIYQPYLSTKDALNRVN